MLELRGERERARAIGLPIANPQLLHEYPRLMDPSAERSTLSITDVTVIDPAGGIVDEHRSVRVRGRRITDIVDGPEAAVNADVTVDGAGRWLIPGLWDMHAHGTAEDLDLYVASGVTGARDMGGAWEAETRAAADATRAHRDIGPRLILGAPIDGEGSVVDWVPNVSGAAAARSVVGEALSQNADFVKVFSFLGRETFLAIAEAARERELPFGGHVPYSVTVEEAVAAGQWTFEHLTGVLHGGSTAEEGLLRDLARVRKPRALVDWPRLWMFGQAAALLESQDAEKRKRLLDRFAERGTWHVPTLAVLRDFAFFDDPSRRDDPRRRWAPPEYYSFFDDFFSDFERTVPHGTRAAARELFALEMSIVAEMHAAGVGILAGTDGPPSLPAGASLHDELLLLVQAGLSPLEALRSATSAPARAIGRGDLGTIRVGAVADVVVLDADPLADIRNTDRIHAVVADGRLIDAAEIRAVIERRSAAAASAWDAFGGSSRGTQRPNR